MPTGALPTSDRLPRPSSPRAALSGWVVLASVQIALSFAARGDGGSRSRDIFYRYDVLASSLRDALGLRRFRLRWLGAAVGVVVAAAVVSQALEPLLHAGEEQGYSPEIWRPERALAFALNALVAATVVPFAEELFFRGLGVRVLSVLGGGGAIVATALVFSLAHGLLVALPPLFFFALGLAWVRLRSDSVWPAVLAHGAYNGIALVLAFLTIQ